MRVSALSELVNRLSVKVKGKGNGHILDMAFLSEAISPQKRSGMARIVEGFYSFTFKPTRLPTSKMNHTQLSLPSQPKRVFIANPRGVEG